MAAILINNLQLIHHLGYVHCDIKPGNILLGNQSNHEDPNRIYLIDFGLADKFITCDEESHISFSKNKRRCGTISFMSINSHRYHSLSRRDDLQSLAYALSYK